MKADAHYKRVEARHGAQRVEVGARCRKGKHGECTVMDCVCSCHSGETIQQEK